MHEQSTPIHDPSRAESARRHRSFCVFVLALLLPVVQGVMAAGAGPAHQRMDELLILLQDAQHITQVPGRAPIDTARDAFDAIEEARLQQWLGGEAGLQRLDGLIDELAGHLTRMTEAARGRTATQARATTREIDQPEPEVEIEACEVITPQQAEGFFGTMVGLEAILAAIKWECEEDVGDFNSALACVGPEIAAQTARHAYEFAEFCLAEKRAATGGAILETTRNVADFLDDELKMSVEERATQDSVDELADALDAARDVIDAIDDETMTLDGKADQMLGNQADQRQRLIALEARAAELLFRLQILQADVDDVDQRTSDTEQIADEIRADTLAIRNELDVLRAELDQLAQRMETAFATAENDRIATALLENRPVVRYRMPFAQGGILEQVRELVIQAIAAEQAAGGTVADANKLLNQGNAAFNAGDYRTAWSRYAEAYRRIATGTGFFRREFQR